MGFYKPSELISFLKEHNIHPKKGLSQNFLIDGNIVRKIVQTADVHEDDLVLEIGPGLGVLTHELLKKGKVVAVEKDRFFAEQLSLLKDKNLLQVLMNDFLELDLDMVLKQHLKNCHLVKVVANLPYNITTPIIVKLLNSSLISSITIMVQKEVALRIVAKKNSKDYSAFTLFVNYYAEPKLMFEVSKNCFYPKPKVDSAIVQFNLKKNLPHIDKEKFHELVRKAFHQRRKMLTSSLKGYCDGNLLKQALKDLDLKETSRPEDLSLEQFITLFKKVF